MEKLRLLPRKEFEIILEDETVVKGQYTLWSTKRFCDKKGISLKKLGDALQEDSMTFDDLVEVILCAVESKQREEGKPFIYNDFHVCGWIEYLGGLGSEDYNNLINHAGSEETKEKKSLSQSNGETLNESSTQPV